MSYRGLVCLLFAALAWGQATNTTPAAPGMQAPAPAADAAKTTPQPAEVAPDAAVITVKGVCPDSTAADKTVANPDCKTVITRAQFEGILAAISPTPIPVPARKQIATRYAMAMAMADEAQKEGLDKGERYDAMIKLSRMQVLSQLLNQSMQKKAAEVPDADISDYYDKNKDNYQEASVQRLFIPRTKLLPASKEKLTPAESKKRQADAEAAMKTEAASLQKRAAAGADFAKLQAEAYTMAGMKSKPPSTDMGKVRRNSLPPSQAFVMDLKTGEVSKLISDPSGNFVYKMGAKDTLPEDKVKDEIRNTLRMQRSQASMQALQHSAQPELNDTYFAAPPPKPAAQSDEDNDND